MVFHCNSKNKEKINKNEHNLRDKIRNQNHDYSKFCNGTLQGIFCNFWLLICFDIYITLAGPRQARGICLAWFGLIWQKFLLAWLKFDFLSPFLSVFKQWSENKALQPSSFWFIVKSQTNDSLAWLQSKSSQARKILTRVKPSQVSECRGLARATIVDRARKNEAGWVWVPSSEHAFLEPGQES
jgi:hypothetical protein